MNEPVNLKLSIVSPAASAMMRAWAAVVGRAGHLSELETRVARRGFSVTRPEAVQRLEAIGGSFVSGYNFAIGASDLSSLGAALARQPAADAGFAYEGAAMGLAIADFLTPRRRLFDAYLAGPGHAHEYMAWVGYGWALARLPVAPQRALAGRRNLHCWLALDGYGFHEGYFHWRRRIVDQRVANNLSPDGLRVFDQGLGRSLWFVYGADSGSVADAVDRFPPSRRADLWAGVGLAVAYAGGCDGADVVQLLHRTGQHGAAFAQGVVFAAQARRRAANPVPHLDLACALALGLDVTATADIAVAALPRHGDTLADYQAWRQRVQLACSARLPRHQPPPNGA